MKTLGAILLIVTVLIIIYNVATTAENKRIAEENVQQIQDHPWITMLSKGANLQDGKHAYTFMPPYTGFEITVIAGGLIGLGLTLFTPSRRGKEKKSPQ